MCILLYLPTSTLPHFHTFTLVNMHTSTFVYLHIHADTESPCSSPSTLRVLLEPFSYPSHPCGYAFKPIWADSSSNLFNKEKCVIRRTFAFQTLKITLTVSWFYMVHILQLGGFSCAGQLKESYLSIRPPFFSFTAQDGQTSINTCWKMLNIKNAS